MRKYRIPILLLALSCLLLSLYYVSPMADDRGIPFVKKREQWSIGIIRGATPWSLNSPLNLLNPVFKAEDVTDVPAKFVADPFLAREGDTWYLFFEIYNSDTQQGDLALATSTNTWTWDYQQVVIDEPFHLSYPYVFKSEGEYYLIPESYEVNSIRLYKADSFPTKWSLVKTLVEGRDFVDNSIVHYNDKWWLFASTTSNDQLYLFYADSLLGPWTEHPMSPVVDGNNHIARPSGRLLVYEDQLHRYAMDVDPPLGNHQVSAFKITEITTTSYSEETVGEEPILKGSGRGWNSQAMHQIDPIQIEPGSWIAAVDGYGEYYVFGLNY